MSEQRHCRSCGAIADSSARFCSQCGAGLPTQRINPDQSWIRQPVSTPYSRLVPQKYIDRLLSGDKEIPSERRVITTLFADVVGSTNIADSLDPEDVTEIMNGVFQFFIDPVKRYGGTLARLMGDGILCLFGAPTAQEDDPFRACCVALEILKGAKAYRDTLKSRYGLDQFDVRVGVSTGLAVVGEVGTKDRAEYTAMGDSVNLASRLESLAEPGTALLDYKTWREINDTFLTSELNPMAVRGKSEPIQVFRLEGIKGTPRSEVAADPTSDFVGRTLELEQLQRVLKTSGERHGLMILIVGPPGVGKTRLLAESISQLRERFDIVECRCQQLNESVSYSAVGEVLRKTLGLSLFVDRTDQAGTLRSEVSTLLTDDQTKTNPHELAAALAHVLHLPLNHAEEDIITATPTREIPGWITRSMETFFRLVARKRRLMFVWEDLHWIDRESCAALEQLCRTIRDSELLMVLTARQGSQRVTRIASLAADHCGNSFERIELAPLDRAQSLSILRSALGDQTLPEHIGERVLEVAEGNAFFIEQMARALIDSDFAELQIPTTETNDTQSEFEIPPAIQSAILARVDRLSNNERLVLQAAACIGRSFHPRVLEEVLASDVGHEELMESLDALQNRGLIRGLQHRSDHLLDGDSHESHEYEFDQNLIVDVIYKSMLRTQRKRFHERIASALETLYPDLCKELASAMAHHLNAAGQTKKALEHVTAAADYAMSVHALDSALEFYSHALSLSEKLDDDVEQFSLLIAFRERLGDVAYMRGDYESAGRQFERCLELCKECRTRARLLQKQADVLEKWGRYRQAKDTYERALAEMGEEPDLRIEQNIFVGLCLVHFHLGDFQTSIEQGERALTMARELDDQHGEAQATNNLAIVCAKTGETDRAAGLFNESCRLWMTLGDKYQFAACLNNRGCLSKENGQLDSALRDFSASLELFDKLGNQHGIARVCDNIAEIHNILGNDDKAEEYMSRAVSILVDIGADQSGLKLEMWQSGVW